MATTTTNFGWDIPQSTDLVKDGATAIAALGQDIDTALIDLKGGTTGQVLAKASATDLDFSWVAQDDSNAIQNAIVDAKGDLIGATAADTPARLAVGTNGQVLTADSTAATGLAWATKSDAGMVLLKTQAFSAVASQSINDVFSSTYDNYRIVIRSVASVGGTDFNIRLRVSAADSTANATRQRMSAISTTVSGSVLTANTLDFGSIYTTLFTQELLLTSPFLAVETGVLGAGGSADGIRQVVASHSAATSFTGFTIYPASGTITGTLWVYGLAK
jgi:hypothetical protein